jgi:hypothetical protein
MMTYISGLSMLGNEYSDKELAETPDAALMRRHSDFFPEVNLGIGYANSLWRDISLNPSTGRFDPSYAVSTLSSLSMPGFISSQNNGLRKYLGVKYFYDLNESEKNALMAAYADYLKKYPAREASVLWQLPASVWGVVRDWVRKPSEMLNEMMKSWEAFNIPWRTILVIGGLGIAAVFLLPTLGRTAGAYARARRSA